MKLKIENISKDFTAISENYYEWNRSQDPLFIDLAHQYSFNCVGFYTDYFDVDGIRRTQVSYDRKKVATGIYPLGCFVVRSNIAKYCVFDEECLDYACFELWLKLTELGPFAHLSYIGFKELQKKQYHSDKSVVFQKALLWK